MGKGGKGGGKGGFKGWLLRSRLFRGTKLGGLCPYTNDMLKQVAIQRGFQGVDELLASLGKQDADISLHEAVDLMKQECGHEAYNEFLTASVYSGRSGRRNCESLLKTYLEGVRDGEYAWALEHHLKTLRKYCGYDDKEDKF